MLEQERPNLFNEKSIGDDVWKMPERSDEQQPLAGALDFRGKSRQIDAAWDDGDVRLIEERATLVRHDDHSWVAAGPFLFESLPAPIVPALGDAGRAVANLTVQGKRDIVFHQHVAAVGREHGVFHLHRLDIMLSAEPG